MRESWKMTAGDGREIGDTTVAQRRFRYRRGEKQTEVETGVAGGVRERKCKG